MRSSTLFGPLSACLATGWAFAEGPSQARLLQSFVLAETRVSGVVVDPRAHASLVYAGTDGKITQRSLSNQTVLWSVDGFEPLRGYTQSAVQHVAAFSADGELVAMGRTNQSQIVILRSRDGRLVTRIQDGLSKSPGVLSLQFSADNQFLVASHWRDRSVVVWDVLSGLEVSRVREEPPVASIFSPDPSLASAAIEGSSLVVQVDRQGTKVWDYRLKTVQLRFLAPRLDPFSSRTMIRAAAISPDGRGSLLLLVERNQGGEQHKFALAFQSNESGKILKLTQLQIPGDQFVWLQGDFEKLIARGFAAGTFFNWNAFQQEPAETHPTKGTWLNENYGWPADIPFQGFVSPDDSFALTIIDTGVIGHWKVK